MYLSRLYSLHLDIKSIEEKPKLQTMSASFYNFDHYIEANEKRDAAMRIEYDKTLSQISNILIIYSGISVFLFSICKDFFITSINIWYLITQITFGLLFLISFIYAILFLFPVLMPLLNAPKDYYDLRRNLETAVSNESDITDEIKEGINHQIKTAYSEELENIVYFNLVLVRRKRDYYTRSLKYAIFSIFPFFICMIFHLKH